MREDALPDCALIHLLEERASQREDVHFEFMDRLRDFRRRVSDEVRFINVLFPEYTPHDEQYHLKRLFSVAETVLGLDLLKAFNVSELFVLAASLYGHDWGMAVSEPEKQLILTGTVPEGVWLEDVSLLPKERESFRKYAREQQIPLNEKGYPVGEVSIELWREYVRKTHAFRSGARVRRYFESHDSGVAEAVARVCEGHWLDFEQLQDHNAYPTDFSVLGQPVNLRALSVYLRLVDMLDLAEDRTPYVIWKFVAPRNPRSRMEWAKHRALQAVTAAPYQEGRILRVDGGTDNHEVYAALEDLKAWCDEQFRCCSDLLARMNDPIHRLDLFGIHWRIQARGFEAVSIQFEFDRSRMFEILSDEIYQGDPYVFLRELLQNSIDAIRLRREAFKRKRLTPGDIGLIEVDVEHSDNGDAVVTFRDDGAGMDEYIVRNYLAIAGRSYYRSADFEREGLPIDPISRFGVGILSCFMVAERIEIETFREPYLLRAKPLRITIPAVQRRFRIEVLSEEDAQVGTTVRVYVEGRKVLSELDKSNADEDLGPTDKLAVTDYLTAIAGFVEFPIVVREAEKRAVILHPKHEPESIQNRVGDKFEIRQLGLSFPWVDTFVPQDLAETYEYFREQRYDLVDDLKLADLEGVLSYVVPKPDVLNYDGYIRKDAALQQPRLGREIELERAWGWGSLRGVGKTGTMHSRFTLYKDGILVPGVVPPRSFQENTTRPAPLPLLRVNLPKAITSRVDLSRTMLLDQLNWEIPIRTSLLTSLSREYLEWAKGLPPLARFDVLGKIIVYWQISTEELLSVFSAESIPVALIGKEGTVEVLEWQDLVGRPIYSAPTLFSHRVWYETEGRSAYGNIPAFRSWRGDSVWVPDTSVHPVSFFRKMADVASQVRRTTHNLNYLRFLHPPWAGDPPLPQSVWVPNATLDLVGLDEEVIIDLVAEDPAMLGERMKIVFNKSKKLHILPPVVDFTRPFEEFFAYGMSYLNARHPLTLKLFQLFARSQLAHKNGALSSLQIGILEDNLRDLGSGDIVNKMARVGQFFEDIGMLGDREELIVSETDFVPGSLSNVSDSFQIEDAEPFGEVLT